MRHAFLIAVVSIAGYIALQLSNKNERKRFASLVTRHGLRLGLLLLILALMLALAVQLPATSLI